MEPYPRTHPDTAVAVDFDGVLFDSDGLVEYWAEVLEKEYHISEFVTLKTYRQGVENRDHQDGLPAIEHFSQLIASHFQQVQDTEALTPEQITELLIQKTRSVACRFVYDDAKQFCEKLVECSMHLSNYILSRGHHAFQLAKIEATGLGEYFKIPAQTVEPLHSRVLITRDSKGPYLYELSKNYNRVIFFDDKLSMLQESADFMRANAPDRLVYYVWVNRLQGRIPTDISIPNLWAVSKLMPGGWNLAVSMQLWKPE